MGHRESKPDSPTLCMRGAFSGHDATFSACRRWHPSDRSSSGGSRYMYPPVVLEEKELWWSASANAEKVQFLPAGQVERSYRMEWRRSYRAGIYLVH
ncbi:hypothetical protein LTR29_004313 [Friedmanniomyces endolithicus]|nr:hypothetical protein LTR29_004313 [Friedmanniomyces endolithicus]